MQKITLLDRWFPHPFVSFMVFVTWLMLSQV
jgi:multicomponent K+:H+ antiporter subunit E